MHGSCVSINDWGVLIEGEPGSGKSSLTLRLIDEAGHGTGDALYRGQLVADDQVIVEQRGEAVFAKAPLPLKGLLEIRGLGIVSVPFLSEVRLRLLVKLTPFKLIERLPEPLLAPLHFLGCPLPSLTIDGFLPTAPAIVRAAIGQLKARA